MADISAIVARSVAEYRKRMQESEVISKLTKRLDSGRFKDFSACNEYSSKAADILFDIYEDAAANIPDPDERQKLFQAMSKENYKYVSPMFRKAQEKFNKDSDIGLKPIKPKDKSIADTEAIAQSSISEGDSKGFEVTRNAARLMSQSIVDRGMQENAAFQYGAGMKVLVSREYDNVGVHTTDKGGGEVCHWCLDRCGTDVPYNEAYAKGMFERHPGCGCVITYKSAKGTFRQGKGQWEGNSWSENRREQMIRFSSQGDNIAQVASPAITNFRNEYIGRSVGAKSQNYDIMDLQTGEKYHLAEGTYLQNKEVFAGKGTKTKFRDAHKYAERYGGNERDWQHVKAIGIISTQDGDRKASIHWVQCEGIGKKEMFIKEWLD
ncbi:MAG: hypothetical protein PUB39_06930 [Eubacteriales bacterium]|nr:hypothetical protein [Eubacteriales bacterium]